MNGDRRSDRVSLSTSAYEPCVTAKGRVNGEAKSPAADVGSARRSANGRCSQGDGQR